MQYVATSPSKINLKAETSTLKLYKLTSGSIWASKGTPFAIWLLKVSLEWRAVYFSGREKPQDDNDIAEYQHWEGKLVLADDSTLHLEAGDMEFVMMVRREDQRTS